MGRSYSFFLADEILGAIPFKWWVLNSGVGTLPETKSLPPENQVLLKILGDISFWGYNFVSEMMLCIPIVCLR